jgi:hypothetical protein
MFSLPQFLLELGLLGWAACLLAKRGWPAVHRPTLWIVTLGAVVTNLAVFLAGHDLLLRLSGVGPGLLWTLALLQLVKWTAVAYFMTRLALSLMPGSPAGGFALLQHRRTMPQILLSGCGIAVVAVVVVVAKFRLEQAMGLHDAGIWAAFQEKAAAMRPMVFWAGLRNLVGEELMPQLGIQTLIGYYAGQRRWTGIAAVLGAALFFELWHDGFQNLQGNNFLFGVFFAYAYRSFGYETAAVAHCSTDWLLYLVLPLLLPR